MKSKSSKFSTFSDFSSSTVLPKLVRCISGIVVSSISFLKAVSVYNLLQFCIQDSILFQQDNSRRERFYGWGKFWKLGRKLRCLKKSYQVVPGPVRPALPLR